MRAGRLRHRITIERNAGTADAAGHAATTWVQQASRWASVEPLQGRELWQAREVHPEVTHRVTLRWLDGITRAMRIKHETRVFGIEAILNTDERDVEMVCLCREQVS